MTGLSQNSESGKPFDTFINYLFWILLILFTNPGGVINALNIFYISGKVNFGDLLFVALTVCYFVIPKVHTIFDIEFIRIRKYLLIFLIYYLIVFLIIVPFYNENKDYSMLGNLIKSRYSVYTIVISLYMYEFFKRRWDVFLKVFLFSSIIVLILFIITVVTKINILPVGLMNRDYINIDRNLMNSEGLMPFLIPLGAVILVFNLKIRFRFLILTGFSLMSLAYVLELWRRNIAAIFIFFILAILADLFITKRYTVLLNNVLKITLLITFIAAMSYLLFPRYVDAAFVGIQKSFSVLEGRKNVQGEKDVRMTLDRPFINEKFYNHPFFGTGFDNRWRTKSGDDQGFEASDYPFLSALAMFGIVGILFFLPIYIVIVKILMLDFNYMRLNNDRISKSFLFLFIMSFLLFFAFDLMQYFNYFQGASNSESCYWYFLLSLYLAGRSRFYSFEFGKNNLELNVISEKTNALSINTRVYQPQN